jgi:hypothetical protein
MAHRKPPSIWVSRAAGGTGRCWRAETWQPAAPGSARLAHARPVPAAAYADAAQAVNHRSADLQLLPFWYDVAARTQQRQRPPEVGLMPRPSEDDARRQLGRSNGAPDEPELEEDEEDGSEPEEEAEPDELSEEGLIVYLADHIQRAIGAVRAKPTSDPTRTLALGGAVELFNLAEQFGLMADVRELADERVGGNAYAAISQAMQELLRGGRPPGGPAAGGPRPGDGGRSPRRSGPPPRR